MATSNLSIPVDEPTIREARKRLMRELFLAYDDSLVVVDGRGRETTESAQFRQAMKALEKL